MDNHKCTPTMSPNQLPAISDCPNCGGHGLTTTRICPVCEGEGTIPTFLICPGCGGARERHDRFEPHRPYPGSPDKDYIGAYVCYVCRHAILDTGAETCECEEGARCGVHRSKSPAPERTVRQRARSLCPIDPLSDDEAFALDDIRREFAWQEREWEWW